LEAREKKRGGQFRARIVKNKNYQSRKAGTNLFDQRLVRCVERHF